MTRDNTHTNVYPATKAARMANQLVRDRSTMNKDELLQFPTPALSSYLNPFMAGDLITIIGRPQNGKSLIAMWLLMNALEKIRDTDNQAVILVNLEVSIERAILQLMSFMSGISMTQALRGELTSQEYRGLGIAALKVGTLPLFIIGHSTARSKDKKRARPDLSPPNLSKAIDFILNDYRSEQGEPIEPALIVIDYLQRIHKQPKVDRAEHMLVCVDWSKDLAYWAGCPVILNVQAGRKVDERPVPMPTLADGQWCLSGDTTLVCAKTGKVKTIKEWMDLEQVPYVHSLGDDFKLHIAKPSHLIESGIQDAYEMTTFKGRKIIASPNHKFYTSQGWTRLDNIQVGDYVAIARHTPTLEIYNEILPTLANWLGAMIGDGNYTKTPNYCYGHDEKLGDYIEQISKELFPTANIYKKRGSTAGYVFMVGKSGIKKSNPIINYLREIGLYQQKHDNAVIPQVVMQSSNSSIACFLQGLFTADGSYSYGKTPIVSYATTSPVLVRQVGILLNRLGIVYSIRKQLPINRSVQDCYYLTITGYEYVNRYWQLIGYSPSSKLDNAHILPQKTNQRSADAIPPNMAFIVIDAIKDKQLRARFGCVKGRGISYKKLLEIADVLDNQEFRNWATADITWVKVKSIELKDREVMYDLRVPDYHNFVANGIVVKNTSNVEQSSDYSFGVFMPKVYKLTKVPKLFPTYPLVKVTDNLLLLPVLKQKDGPAGDVFHLHVIPQTLTVTELDIPSH